ncbi:MAG: hypothetical protein PVH80_06105 [Anaerolineae bacterium]|jgi:hypothetical protein
MKRAIAVILFIVAGILIIAALGSALTRLSVGLAPEYGVDLVMIAVGAVAIWGGARLWRQA